MTPLADFLASLGDVSAPPALPETAALRDEELLESQRVLAEVQRRLSAATAAIAGEISFRSRRELGHDGLAAKHGERSAEGLISRLTGGSTRDARTLVRTAELLPTPARATTSDEQTPAAHPRWLATLGEAVAAATISAEAADLIRSRLAATEPVEATSEQREAWLSTLAETAARLVAEAPGLTLEQLAGRAAAARDDIDSAGIAARERALHGQRYLRVTKLTDGMTRLTGLLDPESAAIVVPILDAATSPRRGGPRFVQPDAAARADELVRDERTTDQLTLDTLVELVRIGARVDDGKLLGDRKPAVRILVTKADLEAPGCSGVPGPDCDGGPQRPGAAYFEGQNDAVSIATAERYICASGAIPILFDGDGRVLNLGREQRLFSEKQRIALAARDGGCLMCDRPPSWCDAHHIDHWDEHHGQTDIDDGVLLCRFCHLLVHNRRWRIRREGGGYRLEHLDANGVLRSTPLPSRSRARDRLLATA